MSGLTRHRAAALLGVAATASFLGSAVTLTMAGHRSQAWLDAVVRENCHPAQDIPAPDNHLIGWISLVLAVVFTVSALGALALLAERGRWWTTGLIAIAAMVLTPVVLFFLWASTETITQSIDMVHGIDGTGLPCGSG